MPLRSRSALALALLATCACMPRLQPMPNVVGVPSANAYVWILRTERGAALVDAGLDASAQAVLDELRAQGLSADDVHTILLTHGHVDHSAGAARFGRARVLVGAGDAALVRGERQPAAWFARFLTRLFGPKVPAPPRLEELTADARLSLDGEPVDAVLVPGHTPGSAVYLYRGLLFTGDSLLRNGNHALAGANPIYTDDLALNRASLAKLRALPFTRVADGHFGVTEDAKAKLDELLRRR